jgi:arylsulfatase A-like enzyme
LQELAEESSVFSNCITAADGTDPSHASILSSVYPPMHGTNENAAHFDPGPISTLPERMHEAGFDTCGAVAVEHLGRYFGFARGFKTYFDSSPWDYRLYRLAAISCMPSTIKSGIAKIKRSRRFGGHSVDGKTVMTRAYGWLSEHSRNPFFLWIHLFDAHGCAFREQEYDRRLLRIDELLRGFFSYMRGENLLDNTAVVITSDHGEAFGEHGYYSHGVRLYDESIKVPLMIWARDLQPGVHSAQVRTIDIAPTICELAGVSTPSGWIGQSLVPYMDGNDHTDLIALSYGACPRRVTTKSIRTGEWKYIVYTFVDHKANERFMAAQEARDGITGFNDGTSDELFHLVHDPEERRNVLHMYPSKVEELQALFFRHENAAPQSANPYSRPEDAHIVSVLRDLGYM